MNHDDDHRPVARHGPDAEDSSRHFVFDGASWEYYERTLEELQAAHSRVRVTYDDGRMEFMTLSPRHAQIKTIAARLLEMYSIEADVPITGFGSLTLRKKALRKGTEPDECYYVTSTPPGPRRDRRAAPGGGGWGQASRSTVAAVSIVISSAARDLASSRPPEEPDPSLRSG